MLTIRIITLLVKIANGEEVPEFIKVYDEIYEYDDSNKLYLNSNNKQFLDIYNGRILNYEAEIFEVEPIEDTPKEDKKIKKLGTSSYKDGYLEYSWTKSEEVLKDKINEIINKINGE